MIKNRRIILCKKQLDDAVNDYMWKTDPELAKLDACQPLDMSFNEYLYIYINELQMSPIVKHEFSIATLNGEHIGNCAYYNINYFKGEAEVGIMLGNRKYWNQGYGAEAMLMLVDYIYNKHNFKRVYLKTLDYNVRAQHCFIKCGFTPCGTKKQDGHSFIVMEMAREKWQSVKEAMSSVSAEER
ncbi:MAG: GNAT family N-acetyltransferase [Dehalococcoidales bacterium]|jgi:RimJ/RimL family protein N-acetyltransferase|nr:GNAT family N-acetyltransferase [Dehalococcoidales bacterium]